MRLLAGAVCTREAQGTISFLYRWQPIEPVLFPSLRFLPPRGSALRSARILVSVGKNAPAVLSVPVRLAILVTHVDKKDISWIFAVTHPRPSGRRSAEEFEQIFAFFLSFAYGPSSTE